MELEMKISIRMEVSLDSRISPIHRADDDRQIE